MTAAAVIDNPAPQKRRPARRRNRPPYEELGRVIWRRYRRYAISQVAAMVKSGELPHPSTLTCAYCGRAAAIYKHRNYHRHTDVVPACDSCNNKLPPAALDPRVVLDHIEGRSSFYTAVEFSDEDIES